MADKSGYMCRYIKIDRFYGSKIRLIDQRMGNLCKINLFLNYLVGSKESPGRKRKREEGRGKSREEDKGMIGKSRNS